MKLKEMIKRFWTLDVHNHEGFTLVELIIVIAILAILSSVAVVGYSSYIKKANMQADKTLVAEIANALTLYYYSNSNEFESGYVVICPEGVDAKFSNDAMNAAMVAAYGEEWAKQLHLKYNEWLPEGAEGGTITELDGTNVVNTIGALTGWASAATGGNKPGVITNVLSLFCGLSTDEANELVSYQNDENYATIATNLMVKYLSDEISNMTVVRDDEGNTHFVDNTGNEISTGGNLAVSYALLYAMANSDDQYSTQAKAKLEEFQDTLEDIANREAEDSDAVHVQQELTAAWQGLIGSSFEDESGNTVPFAFAYGSFCDANGNEEINSIIAATDAMSGLAADYKDAATLSNSNLFSSNAMKNAVAGYQEAAKYGGIVIVIDEEGSCTIMPNLS